MSRAPGFRVLMAAPIDEDSLETLAQGGVPRLKALVLHNGTVWRWNRPCFGITENHPHLRLEFRVLPAGPTVLDEVVNAAFLLGLMRSLPKSTATYRQRCTSMKPRTFLRSRAARIESAALVDRRRAPLGTEPNLQQTPSSRSLSLLSFLCRPSGG